MKSELVRLQNFVKFSLLESMFRARIDAPIIIIIGSLRTFFPKRISSPIGSLQSPKTLVQPEGWARWR